MSSLREPQKEYPLSHAERRLATGLYCAALIIGWLLVLCLGSVVFSEWLLHRGYERYRDSAQVTAPTAVTRIPVPEMTQLYERAWAALQKRASDIERISAGRFRSDILEDRLLIQEVFCVVMAELHIRAHDATEVEPDGPV